MRKQNLIKFDGSEAAEKVREALARPIEERERVNLPPAADPSTQQRWSVQPVPTRSKKRRW